MNCEVCEKRETVRKIMLMQGAHEQRCSCCEVCFDVFTGKDLPEKFPGLTVREVSDQEFDSHLSGSLN